jgi:hypothetical protein
MINTGKTPALNVLPLSKVYIWNGEPPPIPRSEVEAAKPVSHGLLAPGTVPASGAAFSTSPFIADKGSVDAYNSGKSRIYVRAILTYRDISGVNHWTTICILHFHGTSLEEFSYCQDGNDADNNRK